MRHSLDLCISPVLASCYTALGGGVDVSKAAAQVRSALSEPSSLVSPGIDLEATPYHAILENLPLNTYKNKAPHTGAIKSVKRIVGVNAPGEVCHIHIDCGPTFRYWEGQSLGVNTIPRLPSIRNCMDSS